MIQSSRSCRVTAEKTPWIITEKSPLKHGLKWSKPAQSIWLRTLTMNNYCGLCLILTSGHAQKPYSEPATFQPNPLWFWWWYGYTTYHPNPTYSPNVNVPTQSGPAPKIPGADFANNIATSVEKTSNNIVVNMEKFANAIVPPPPKASHDPAHQKRAVSVRVQHVPVLALAFHALVHVQAEEATK